MYNESYDDLRKRLMEMAKDINDIRDPRLKEFSQSFSRLMELLLFSLIQEKDNFFAHVIMQMRRKIEFTLPAPAAVSFAKTHFDLLFNPLMMVNFNIPEMKAILIHECYHIFNQHLVRAKKFNNIANHTIVNIGLDCAINQYINDLPEGCISIDSLRNDWGVKVNIEPEREAEYYIKLLRDEYNNNEDFKNKVDKHSGKDKGDQSSGNGSGNGNSSDELTKDTDLSKMHDSWKNSDFADSDKDANYDDVMKDMLNQAQQKTRGKIPGQLEELIKKLNEPPIIPWHRLLRQYVGRVPVPYKRTIMRRDRRQPHRYDIKGKLNDHQVDIIVAIDTSGSMSDAVISYCINEVFDIVKHSKATVTILECDYKISRVYEAKKPSDVKPDVTGRSGTAYQPVFDWIKENGKRDSIVVYFTDGYGENNLDSKPACFKTLWVITEGDYLSLQNPYGEVKLLNLDEKWKKMNNK